MRTVDRARRLPASAIARASLVALLLTVVAGVTPAFAATGDRDGDRDHSRVSLEDVREATQKFRNLSVAEKAGYVKFYVCTAEPGQGAMGQHFVNGSLAADPAIDPLRPEALVYQPLKDGRYQLVALEYVTFKADWNKLHSSPPRLFGHTFGVVPAPNRYSLPDFYELHVWLYKSNPSGMFFEWNPRVHCPDA